MNELPINKIFLAGFAFALTHLEESFGNIYFPTIAFVAIFDDCARIIRLDGDSV